MAHLMPGLARLPWSLRQPGEAFLCGMVKRFTLDLRAGTLIGDGGDFWQHRLRIVMGPFNDGSSIDASDWSDFSAETEFIDGAASSNSDLSTLDAASNHIGIATITPANLYATIRADRQRIFDMAAILQSNGHSSLTIDLAAPLAIASLADDHYVDGYALLNEG